ncbi:MULTISPECIES: hypothetical protein [unclassified Bradyrhizobium]|uniref:hypothetical protein n=1 Tax=unclassified Bradyrhizobium TaxID=2631580 RepID=UPI002916F11C|nr:MULTISPECIES: hypothetical protein [unclassified Bradyrhizobium]
MLVGFEQPSLFIKTTPTTVVKLACYGPALEKQCSKRYGLNIRVRQINPSDVCMFWCGRGMKGQAKKDEFVRIAKLLGFAVSNDDEADAIACWFYMVHCFGSPEERRRFEQMRFEVGMGRAQKAVL